jgi:hypothetical protein
LPLWDPNTHSIQEPTGHPAGRPDALAALAADVDELAGQDLDRLPDPVRAERVLRLRRLVDRLEGQWLNELAGVDAHGAAGAEEGQEAGSTAGWLRHRLHLGASTAASSVRTARALFRGPLAATAQAVVDGEVSVAHAQVLAHGTSDLPDHVRQAERRHQRRRLWLTPTFEGMVAIDGLLEAEAGQTLLSVLEPLARPADAADTRSGGQRRADALAELARRSLEGERLPQTGGVRPRLTVMVDLDSLLGRPGAVGGEVDGGAGPLPAEACRRLACDGAVTRVLVSRHPSHQRNHHPHPGHGPTAGDQHHPTRDGDGDEALLAAPQSGAAGLQGQLRAAMALLSPILGGAPSQPLDLGRTSRAVHEGGWRLTRHQPDGRFTATPPYRRHPTSRGHPTAA